MPRLPVDGIPARRGGLPLAPRVLAGPPRRLTGVPLYAGFGISTPGHAPAVAELVDGVVVGSRAVQVAEDGAEAVRDYVATLRTALDG